MVRKILVKEKRKKFFFITNPAYRRHRISRPMWKVAPILFSHFPLASPKGLLAFSLNWPQWADSVIELPCPCVCVVLKECVRLHRNEKNPAHGQHSALSYVWDSGVSILYHEYKSILWVLPIPWIYIYIISPCQYHESMSILWVVANNKTIPWVLKVQGIKNVP